MRYKLFDKYVAYIFVSGVKDYDFVHEASKLNIYKTTEDGVRVAGHEAFTSFIIPETHPLFNYDVVSIFDEGKRNLLGSRRDLFKNAVRRQLDLMSL